MQTERFSCTLPKSSMKTIILDFDGTLADSLPLIIDIAEDMLGKDHALNRNQIEKLRGMSARDVLKFGKIPYWQLPALLLKGRRLLMKRLDELEIFAGIPEVVNELNKKGYQLCVVSSNGEEIIRTILRRYRIESHFSGVYGGVLLFNKARALTKVMKDQKANKHECVYVGDEVRDIEAAHKAKIEVISVTWGYNNKKILKTYKPEHLVETPRQLLEVLEKI